MAKKTIWQAKLRRVRKAAGLTQAQAADRIGVALRTWICWENGHRNPSRLAQQIIKQKFPDF